MRTLLRSEVDPLLLVVGLKIGNWNELADIAAGGVLRKAYRPPNNAIELYVAAGHLLNWLAPEGWTLLQVDNSTAPTDDEIRVFERLVFGDDRTWDVGGQRSFLFDDAGKTEFGADQATLVLLVFFSLLFEWHVYLTSQSSTGGRRLGLLDGVAYFFGDAKTIEQADMLTTCVAEDPLRLS